VLTVPLASMMSTHTALASRMGEVAKADKMLSQMPNVRAYSFCSFCIILLFVLVSFCISFFFLFLRPLAHRSQTL
jgi:hypothetical protein